MNEITQNDVVAVGGGDGRRGEGMGAQSSMPAVAAGRAADAGSEGGEGAEWQMVTRGKAKAGGLKKTVTKVKPRVADGSKDLQQVTPGFEAASTAMRKRKAEDSVNDKLAALADAVAQLAMAQKDMTENHKALVESNTIMMEMIKTQAKDIKVQGEEIKALRALIQEGVSQRTYSEAITSGSTPTSPQSSQTRSTSAGSLQVRKDKPQVQDDRAVSIDMARFKGAKNNYNVIRDGLRAGLKVNKVTEKLTIKSLRPGPGDRIDVVFADKDEANKVKQHTR
jgi:hypothetical protein